MNKWKKECYERWAKTPTQVEKETNKITLKGLRLTRDEKDTIFFLTNDYPHEYTLEEPEKLKDFIIRERKETKECEQNEGKQLREFAKEIRRLERKYDCFHYEDKTIDELVEMWIANYFCLYFLDDHLDSIMYDGGKNYAQYYLYNAGVIPESEVKMWQ